MYVKASAYHQLFAADRSASDAAIGAATQRPIPGSPPTTSTAGRPPRTVRNVSSARPSSAERPRSGFGTASRIGIPTGPARLAAAAGRWARKRRPFG
jgi:hypothetical protein